MTAGIAFTLRGGRRVGDRVTLGAIRRDIRSILVRLFCGRNFGVGLARGACLADLIWDGLPGSVSKPRRGR